MIAGLSGILIEKDFGRVVLDVGGVHYEVSMSATAVAQAPKVGEKISLHCHMNVREDVIQLFGFLDRKEQQVFTKLIAVNGVGPKLAITILSGSSVEQFREAILSRDSRSLQGIPGIGKKTSERLVLELKDKFESESSSMPTNLDDSGSDTVQYREVVSALENLGYKKKAAELSVKQLLDKKNTANTGEDNAASFPVDWRPETLLRDALAILNSPKGSSAQGNALRGKGV